MTVKRYWSSLPYRLRSRLVLYSFPSSSASWCLRSSSGTRWVPVDSATTFVRRVLTERSLRTLRPPSFLESSAVWIALRTCVYVGGWVCGGWSACGPYGRCGLRLSFTDEKLCKSGCWFTRVVWHTALRVRCARCSSVARAHLRRGARMCGRTRVDRPRGFEFGVSGSERASAECDPSRVGSTRASPVPVAAAALRGHLEGKLVVPEEPRDLGAKRRGCVIGRGGRRCAPGGKRT